MRGLRQPDDPRLGDRADGRVTARERRGSAAMAAPSPQRCGAVIQMRVRAYWASQPRGTSGMQTEPYIHNGGAGIPDNILLEGNLIHGMQTKDPTNATPADYSSGMPTE